MRRPAGRVSKLHRRRDAAADIDAASHQRAVGWRVAAATNTTVPGLSSPTVPGA